MLECTSRTTRICSSFFSTTLLSASRSGGDDLQQEVVFAGHRVAADDLLDRVDVAPELLDVLVRVPLEPDLHERLHVQAQRRRIDDRRVALDDAGLLQQLHAASARRVGQADLLRELDDVRRPSCCRAAEDRGVERSSVMVIFSK